MSKSKRLTFSAPSLVFFGSGPVGVATLEGLSAAGFGFEGIITKPKPAHHRGSSPVLEFAKSNNIATYTPRDKKELEELFEKEEFSAPAGLVVDYGLIIPKKIIDLFPFGIINSHFSLLPQWRGADPITFALLSGQPKTGISLMLLKPKLDTGPLLAQAEYDIVPGETITTLTDNLVELSNKTLAEVVPLYLAGKIETVPQDSEETPTYSRKLAKQDGVVDWQKPAEQLEREVRAFLGWPKSRASIDGHDVIITKARVAQSQDDGDLVIKCRPGWLEIQQLVAPSGRKMTGADFLRGYKKA